MKRLLISTTNIIENAEILEYKGIVSSSIVTGAGFFSDLAAGFTDFFGGRSESYQNQMYIIYQEALDDISLKASRTGANAIIGFHIDFDNISGKGMSMFMVNVIGTAVKVEFKTSTLVEGPDYIIPFKKLERELKKRKVLSQLSDGGVLEIDLLDEINKDPLDDYAIEYSNYIKRILQSGLISYNDSAALAHFREYLSLINRENAISAIYPLVGEPNLDAIGIIRANKLFDAESIENLIDRGLLDDACNILTSSKPTYTEVDITSMKALSVKLHNLPDKGSLSFVKGGLFSKDGEKYICPEGHVNNKEIEFCEKCGLNIKGLTKDNVRSIKQFDEAINALEYLLK